MMVCGNLALLFGQHHGFGVAIVIWCVAHIICSKGHGTSCVPHGQDEIPLF